MKGGMRGIGDAEPVDDACRHRRGSPSGIATAML